MPGTSELLHAMDLQGWATITAIARDVTFTALAVVAFALWLSQ